MLLDLHPAPGHFVKSSRNGTGGILQWGGQRLEWCTLMRGWCGQAVCRKGTAAKRAQSCLQPKAWTLHATRKTEQDSWGSMH
eukprot:10908770-Alexandrium_andersonii.AAC.1